MEDVNFLDPTNMASKLQNCVLSVIVEDDDGEDETNIGENLIQNVCEQANVDEKQVRDMLLETAMLSISNDYVRSLRVIGKWKSFTKSKKDRRNRDQEPNHIHEEIIEENNVSIVDKLFIDILELSKASSDEVIKNAIPEKVQMIKEELKKFTLNEIKAAAAPNSSTLPASSSSTLGLSSATPPPPPLPPPPPPPPMVSKEPKVKIKTVNGLQHVEIRVKKSNKDSLMDELKNKLRKRQNSQDFQIRKE